MTETNKNQISFWNGDMADRWIKVQDALDEFFDRPLAELLRMGEPASGDRVLDVGCGAGASTFAFAQRIGSSGSVHGVDVSKSLLERAKQRASAQGLENISFAEADAQVYPFETGAFDLMVSRFGVMFFEDPVAAFRNLASALKPDGRMAFVAWSGADDNNPWFSIPRDIAIAKLGPPLNPPDPDAPSPFAFADVERVVSILEDAGLTQVSGARQELELEFEGTAENAAAFMATVGPAARLLIDYNASPEVAAALQRDVAREIKQFMNGTTLRTPAAITAFTARRG